jgi:hypothetical protein
MTCAKQCQGQTRYLHNICCIVNHAPHCRGLQQSSAGSLGWADAAASEDDDADRLGNDDRTADEDDGDDNDASDGSGSGTHEDPDEQRGTGRKAKAPGGNRKLNSSRGQLPVVKLSKFEEDRLQQRKEQHKVLVAQPKVCAEGWWTAKHVVLVLAWLAMSVS